MKRRYNVKGFDKEWLRIKNATKKHNNAYCIYKVSYIDILKNWFYGCLSKLSKEA